MFFRFSFSTIPAVGSFRKCRVEIFQFLRKSLITLAQTPSGIMNVNGLIQPHHIGDLAQAIVYGLILPHHISQVLIQLLVLINPEPVRGAAMPWNALATWNGNQSQWRDSQWQRDDSHCQWLETTSRQMATFNALLVSIRAEQQELNRKMRHIEELVATAASSFSRPPPPPPPPPPAAAPPGRRKKQRSLSWPLSPSSDTDCDWHCVGTDGLRIDDTSYEVIRRDQYLANSSYWSHLDAMLYDDQGFTKAMFDSLALSYALSHG